MPTASAVFGDIIQAAVTEGRPAESRLWKEGSVKLVPYADVKADIVVRLDSKADELLKIFEGYSPVALDCGDAVIVTSITHGEADRLCAQADGAKWFHILR